MAGSKPPAPRRARPVGPDGRTLGERVRIAMAESDPPMTEAELLAECTRIVRAHTTKAKPLVSQQLLNAIIRDTVTQSAYTPIIAEALRVRPVWLAFGIGPMREGERLLKRIVAAIAAEDPAALVTAHELVSSRPPIRR